MIRNWQYIVVPSLKVNGVALYPFLLMRKKEFSLRKEFINHERIHFKQQIELIIVLFYILYAGNYLINRVKIKNHKEAYRMIIFERESYDNESDPAYLKTRKWYAWRMYLFGNNKN